MQILIFITILLLLVLFIKFNYKKCKTNIEKVIFMLYMIICATPIIIYYLDVLNIPSQLNLTKNIDSKNWLNFLFTYISTIVSSIIGVTASIFIAFNQIKKNNEENERRDKENLRIQNMPLLKYNINTETEDKESLGKFITTTIESGQVYEIKFSFKNIGLNSVKNIIIDYESNVTNSTYRLLGKDSIVAVEKGEEIKYNYLLALEVNSITKIKLIVYYEDILSNWYKQILNITYRASNESKNGNYIGEVNYFVEKEERIEENEININVIY